LSIMWGTTLFISGPLPRTRHSSFQTSLSLPPNTPSLANAPGLECCA
jgi:hypothetical protein